MFHPSRKVIDLFALSGVCQHEKASGETIILTSGCFDLLHGGHLEYICAAGKLGFLVVGINSDQFVRRLKGESRPIRGEQDRAFTMAGFYPVNLVTVFGCDYELISAVRPHIYVVSPTSHIRIGSDTKRVALLESIGARVVELGSKKTDTTTAMIERAKA